MITNQEWERLEKLLDVKLEQKLEEKLEQKLEQKFDEKLGEFAILMKRAFDEIHQTINSSLERMDSYDTRISQNERNIENIKKVVRV